MRRNISIYVTAAAAAMALLVGCQREGLADGEDFGDGQIRYSVSVAGGTKGALINTTLEDQPLPAGNAFTVSAYKGSEALFTNQTATSSDGGLWTNDDPQYWPLSTKLAFFAYANTPASTVAMNAECTAQTLTYAVPADASKHQDILLGYYYGNGGNKGIAEIHFGHPLTAVRFRQGNMTGVTIKSITLSGLISEGTVTMTSGGIGDWTVGGTEKYETEATLSGGEGSLAVEVGTDLIGTDIEGHYNGAFLPVPQKLDESDGGHSVTVTVVLATADGDVTVSADITSGEWEVGKTNTYTLTYGSNTGFALTVTPWDKDEDAKLVLNDETGLLPGKFSVSSTKYVRFAKGNLFCTKSGESGSETYTFNLEANQYDFHTRPGEIAVKDGREIAAGTGDNESGLFQWDLSGAIDGGDFGAFGSKKNIVGDETELDFGKVIGPDWYTLSTDEWVFFLENHEKVWCTVKGIYGYAFAPNDYNTTTQPWATAGSELSNWEEAESAGVLFIPAAGFMQGEGDNFGIVYADGIKGSVERSGYSWTSTPNGDGSAYYMGFGASEIGGAYSHVRSYAFPVRLVQKFFKPHEYVDLGLPSGTLWATCNVGADSPEEYGDYFQWGGVTPVTSTSINVGWAMCPGNGGNAGYNESAFTTWRAENLTDDVLKPTADAACANWGRDWRMPTSGEFKELCENTYNQWIEENGVYGWKFTNKKDSDKYIFLPAAGSRYDTQIYNSVTNGLYWTSSLHSSKPEEAYYLGFGSSSGVNPQLLAGRGGGCPVRPVRSVHD